MKYTSSLILPSLGLLARLAAAGGNPTYAGVNIAGFDFGCDTSGNCNGQYSSPTSAGTGQMQHFTSQDGLNIFRLPVGWQYLQPSLGATLDSGFLSQYDALMQACLATGAHCILDVHNYARYNGAIVGQGGPTNDQFANLWSQLASHYASDANVIFGVMNEPHDLDINTWAGSVQAAVTAIRNAGATSQQILLPGTEYTSAGAFVSDGSAAALLPITNPAGGNSGLIFDVHQYLDSDSSGTHSNCVTNNTAGFEGLASWLRSNGRQALLSETGGGPTDPTCLTNVCQELQTIRDNNDVLIGWVGWAAGAFDSSYVLWEGQNSDGSDQPLVSQCIAGCFGKDCA